MFDVCLRQGGKQVLKAPHPGQSPTSGLLNNKEVTIWKE